MSELTATEKAKQLQNKIWKICLLIGAIVIVIIYYFSINSKIPDKDNVSIKSPFYDISKDVNDPSYWLWENESKIKQQEETQQKLSKKVEDLKNAIKFQEHNDYKDAFKAQGLIVTELQQKLAIMEEKLNQQPKSDLSENLESLDTNWQHHEALPKFAANNSLPSAGYYQDYDNHNENDNEILKSYEQGGGLVDFKLDLVSQKSDIKNLPNIKDYLPSNTYVPAVLLSGVDVSSGISSQHQPKPVLLRITSFANFPNHMRGGLKSCRVSAQAWGDLSSERAYMRPDILTCVKKDGSVLETSVQGFIAGEDGKVGIRGKMIMRDRELLTRGFIGGMFSGLGQATSESFNKVSTSPLGVTSVTQGADIFKKGAAQGVSNAFDLIAKYHIKRAEQYQPVIQISAGREVDIVFHTGSKFGEINIKPAQPISTVKNELNQVLGDLP